RGFDSTHFKPGNVVTRRAMAGFLHRVAELTQIEGTVTGAGAAPLSGVSVVITGTGSTSATYSTVTAQDGSYAVTDIETGPYTVCFDASAVSGGPSGGYAYECYRNVVGGGSP